jgi:iron(II)-dependent oxidoreductase
MDRTEVTNAQYGAFCKNTKRPLPPGFPQDQPDRPVVNVTFADANAYARWAGKRLPEATEWEKAARGKDARHFPWGNDADTSKASVADNAAVSHEHPVAAASLVEGSSPYGLLHMAGNVFEYVRTEITPSPAALEHFGRILNPPPAMNEPWYSIKGGAFNVPLAQAAPWEFMAVPARYAAPNIGFRCAKDPEQR